MGSQYEPDEVGRYAVFLCHPDDEVTPARVCKGSQVVEVFLLAVACLRPKLSLVLELMTLRYAVSDQTLQIAFR